VNFDNEPYRQNICNEINNNMENDPKKFWSLINKLSNASSGVVSDNAVLNKFNDSSFIKEVITTNPKKNPSVICYIRLLSSVLRFLKCCENSLCGTLSDTTPDEALLSLFINDQNFLGRTERYEGVLHI
jgi:hypothetical protein